MKKLLSVFFLLSVLFANSQSIWQSPTYTNQTSAYVGISAVDGNGVRHLYKKLLSSFGGGGGGSSTTISWDSVTGKPTFYYQTIATNGVDQTQRTKINFLGNFVIVDNTPNGYTSIDLANAIAASTSLTSPLIIGGSGTTRSLTLKATTGTGTTGADIIGVSGTNGGTEIFRATNAGNFGIGTGSTVSAKLHVISTTEQQRLGYNASNYQSVTISSAANATYALTGSGNFNFSNIVNLNAGFRTNSTSDNANIATPSSTGQGTVSSTTAQVTPRGTGTAFYRVSFRGSGSSSVNSGTDYANVSIGQAPFTAVGNSGTTHNVVTNLSVRGVVITNSVSAVMPIGSAIYVNEASSGADKNYAIYVAAGLSRFASASLPITTVSVNTTLDLTHYTVLVDASGGAKTITLPTGAQYTGVVYVIKKIDSSGNAVGFTTAEGSQSLGTQWGSKAVQYNGTNWYIIAN